MSKKVISLLLLIIISILNIATYCEEPTSDSSAATTPYEPVEYKPHAQSMLVTDLKSGMVLYDYNSNLRFSPGSLTKIVTAIVAIENCSGLDKKIAVPDGILANFDYNKFNIGLKYGEEISYKDLINAMIVHDAGDCAIVLGHTVLSSQNEFINQMNSYASKAGAKNTYFSDTCGFDLKGSYTTLTDMNLIVKKALENELFTSIISTQKIEIAPTNKYSQKRILYSTNNFISTYYSSDYINSKIKGVKNYYNSSSDCGNIAYYADSHNNMLVMCAKSNDDINTNYAYKDIEYLIEYANSNYSDIMLIKKDEIISETEITNSEDADRLLLVSDTDLVYKLPNNYDKSLIERKTVLNENIKAPVKKGEILGKTEVYYKGQKCGEVNLLAYETIDNSIITSIKNCIRSILKSFYFWGIIILFVILFIVRTININRRKKK